jgi:ABC-type branched-subunit amino acid transport system ATPase component
MDPIDLALAQARRPRLVRLSPQGLTMLVEQFDDIAAELARQYLMMGRDEIMQRGRGKGLDAGCMRQRMSI